MADETTIHEETDPEGDPSDVLRRVPDVAAMSDEELIEAPAKGIQPGAIGAEADARAGLPTGTTPPPGDNAEPGPTEARELDPDTEVDAVAADLKPDTPVQDT